MGVYMDTDMVLSCQCCGSLGQKVGERSAGCHGSSRFDTENEMKAAGSQQVRTADR